MSTSNNNHRKFLPLINKTSYSKAVSDLSYNILSNYSRSTTEIEALERDNNNGIRSINFSASAVNILNNRCNADQEIGPFP